MPIIIIIILKLKTVARKVRITSYFITVIILTVVNSSSLGAVETAQCFCIWEVCICSYWLQYLVIRLSIRGNNIVLYFCTSNSSFFRRWKWNGVEGILHYPIGASATHWDCHYALCKLLSIELHSPLDVCVLTTGACEHFHFHFHLIPKVEPRSRRRRLAALLWFWSIFVKDRDH